MFISIRRLIGLTFVCLFNANHACSQVFIPLQLLPSANQSQGYDVSMNGAIAVGTSYFVSTDREFPIQWSNTGSPTTLPFLNPASQGNNFAFGISGDGTIVVGQSLAHAVRWTSSGVEDLGVLPSATSSKANSSSFDGSVVVGTSGGNAFRWTQSGMQDLGRLAGTRTATAERVNSNGSVVVGHSGDLGFKWTQANGMQSLPLYPGGNGSDARAVSADGSRIAGRVTLGAGVTDRAAL
jgi:uncharacterized membrane protein